MTRSGTTRQVGGPPVQRLVPEERERDRFLGICRHAEVVVMVEPHPGEAPLEHTH